MMKKFTKAALLLAAGAAFLFAACSHSSGGGGIPNGGFETNTKVVTAAELGASATSAESSDASVVTAEVVDGDVKLTSKKEGSATVTAKADGYSDAKISVTVGVNGNITPTVTQQFEMDLSDLTVTVVCTDESVELTKEQLEKVQYLLNSGDETFAAAIEGYYKDADCTDAYETGDDGLPVLGDDDTALYVKVSVTKEDFLAALENVEVPETPNTPAESVTVSPEAVTVEEEATTTLTATVRPENATNQNVTWTSDNPEFATVSAAGVVTGVAAGTAKITATTEDGGHTAHCTVTVTKKITGTTYAWNFSNTDLVTLLSYDTSASGASKTATEATKVTLKGGATYESTPAGLTLNLPEGGVFNKVAPNGDVSSKATKIKDTATKGSIEPDGNTVLTVRVKGPFKAVMLCASNSGDKSGRYAYIKIGDTEYAPNKEANTLYQVGEEISAVYTEDDEVDVVFGGTDVVRIHDIQITTENGDATGKTAGKVTSLAEFEPGEPVTVTFEELNLESSATPTITEGDNVVSVEPTSEGIKISAKAPGSAKITVTVGNKTATITVTVGGDGEITKKVDKYRDPNALPAWTIIGGDDATFTDKTITINKNSGIYLPVTYTTGQKVELKFTVDKASVNADTGNKICGGFAQDDTFGDSVYAVFASNKGISNGSKVWSNGGSSNGYDKSLGTCVADVTFTVTYTIGQESSDGKDVVLTATATDGTTTCTKTQKQSDVKWSGTAGTVQSSVVPYIYFGSGATDSITVSNITLTVDGTAVTTTN